MLGLRSISLLVAVACALSTPNAFAHEAPVATRNLRAQHNGEDHGAPANAISPGGGEVNPQTGVKNPGGILGPLYAAFPQLLAPLAMASDTVHNSNAAVSGVQHTPDGIFQA